MKVLIVDDEPDVIDFISGVACAMQCEEVDRVTSGEEALTRVIRSDYDLITLDIQMPGLNGLEVLSLIRDMCPHAIIAIVSGHVPGNISPEISGCADVIIEKPVSLETFETLFTSAAMICEAMEKIRLVGRVPVTTR